MSRIDKYTGVILNRRREDGEVKMLSLPLDEWIALREEIEQEVEPPLLAADIDEQNFLFKGVPVVINQ